MLPSLARRPTHRFRSRSALLRAFSTAAAPQGGTLYMCGTGEYNKLGVSDTKDREVPVAVEGLEDVEIIQVSCGKYHTAALSASGDVFAWGLESSGQLGLGSARTKAPVPTKVDALSQMKVKSLSCGLYHTLALTDEGEVWSVGYGGSFFSGAGALGHGNRAQLDTPAKLSAFGDAGDAGVRAASVSAGGYHSIVQDVNGGVWSFGRGEWGRLGHSDSADLLQPQRIEECDHMGAVVSAFAADAHSACLAADGTVFTWGRNEHWQLGYEVAGLLNSGQSFDAQQEPAPVPMPAEAAKAVKLAVGEMGCVSLLEDQSIWMWGMARYFIPTRLPVGEVQIGAKIVDVQMGASHVILLTEDGSLYSFGTGAPLCLPKVERKPWQLAPVPSVYLNERRVLNVSCGAYSTALILE
ncbi:hypothetical protein AB1Y20_010156 [Prymnesium parvum]|uniref:RCC1-like domain-containing protein n=1 Tax=Prymnesium parvum TaxID=97485 RepID=A0AB34K6C9_PRYPA